MSSIPLRPVRLGSTSATVTQSADGSYLMVLNEALGDYPPTLTHSLLRHAREKPQQVFLSMYRQSGELSELTYEQTLAKVEQIGTALLKRNLSLERPIMILSENDLENALLFLAALHVGIPYVPVSPPYSLVSKDFLKLRSVVELIQPGLIFANDGARYAAAIRAVAPADAEIVTAENHLSDPASTPFSYLLGEVDRDPVERAHDSIKPDDVAKILFTSGTTGKPKGVVFPHIMLASQRQQVAQTFAFTLDEPAHMVDWLPWHHTFGGTHNFGTALYSGGSLRIDHGRPMPELVGPTLRNLKEVAPTLYLNTPAGLATLLPHFQEDRQLRENFFSRLKLIYYGGATFPRHLWEAYDRLAFETVGERIMITSGIGCTEAGPTPTSANWDPGYVPLVGHPVPGVTAKIAPVQGKYELRLKGDCVTPGYYKSPDQTRAAFDEDGFFRTGDAVKFIDPNHPERGLKFDGRISENFKLLNGTWVDVADLRLKVINALSPLVKEVVITAPNRDFLGAIVFPDLAECRKLTSLPEDASSTAIINAPEVRAAMQSSLNELCREGTGAASRVVRAVLTDEAATLDTGELTDKSAISQRAVLERRVDLINDMYSDTPSHAVFVAQP